MKHSRLLPILRLLVALCLCVAGAPQARAQVPAVLKDGFRNVFRTEPTGTPIGVAAPLLDGDLLRPAYLLQRQNGTAFGGFSVNGFGTLSTTIADDTPNVHTATTSAPGTPIPPNYPNNAPTVNQVKGSVFTVQMRSAIIGRPLALFGISYSFGAVIPAPLVNQSNSPTLYRAEPVDSRIKTTVLTNNTTGEKSFPAPVEATTADSDGTTVTTNGDTTTTVTVGPNPKFYWSKHAQKVYATQPGTITVKWRETATTAKDITSTYVIATAPDQEERTIYWTENGFRGPPVEVPVGRVNAVNIVYNTLVPKEVVTPYEPWLAGVTDFTESDPLKKRYKTFFYDNNLIHAYNVAGRVFVEYLGNPRGDGTSEQKGIEIVNVIKETSPVVKVVSLGERVDQLRANETGGTATDLEPKILAGLGLGGQPYLHQQVSAGGTTTSLYAIRETQPGMANTGKALDNEVLVYWMETAALNIKWPKQFVGYVQQWPDAPAAYSTYARPDSARASGLAEALATAVPLDSANNPALVYQDDPANAQALLIPGNKFYTKVTTSDPTNRALLRFTKDEDIWFERVWSQLDPYYKDPTPFLVTKTVTSTAKPAGTFTTGFENILNVQVVNPATGAALVAGVDYTVNAATGVITLVKQTVTSVRITFNPSTLPFSTIPDVLNADIGSRINPPPALKADTFGDTAPVYVGYIHQPSGTSFNVDAYQDPFVAGFDEAAKGAIIPINTIPRNDQLEVWWYKKSTPAGAKISGTYWPSFVQKYALKWPAATRENTITLASNKGSDDLPSLQATGSIYTQNNPALAGYNPNEEHALMLNGRAWALRDDLNETTDEITWTSSKPYVLLDYTEADQRPAMRVFQVTRGTFDYPAIAGKVLQSPMPLPLLPPPLLPDRSLASYEMQGVEDPISASSQFGTSQAPGKDAAFVHYKKFTWTDRKGILWVYRGPHGGNEVTTPTLIMRYFYKTLPGFYYPSLAFNNQPAVGKITPYLRRGTPGAYVGDPVTGVTAVTAPEPRAEQPLDVTFRPQWPDSAPELRVGETLTLPKLGLPQVRGQQSAEFIYQQSVATAPVVPGTENRPDMANRQKSARLFDPTRAKVYPLRPTTLSVIPESVNTSLYLGKTYFPNLPPHLSSRLYFDPAVGQYGSLIFKGVYMNELVGEKYLQLNVMSAADRTAAKALTPVGFDTVSTKIKTDWDAAIDGLVTTMETFVEDPGKLGTFIPLRNEIATPRTPIVIDGKNFTIPPGKEPLVATVAAGTTVPADSRPPTAVNELAEVFYSDTAVDSYAISASGGGKGFVVLAVGNGMDTDFTSKDGPVSLQVFKVNAPLYRGELKVINSQNPLDEKLTLQHTGDFAGHPEEYDFEWRYAPPVDGLPLKLYSYVRKLIVTGKNETWNAIHNPLNNTLDPAQSYQKYRSPKAEMSDVVTSIALLSGGSYTVLPGKVTISDDNVSNATATISGEIKDVTIAQGKGGRNYAQPPAVNFVGGGGSGATGVAIVSDGVITRFDITNKGSGYTSAPTVSLTGGGGSGAEATATLQVGSLTLTNGGIGYTEVPTVTFGGGTLATGGSAASATATFGAPPVVNLPGQITIINGNGTAAHGVTLPHALLRRTFSATQRPLRLFLSLDVGTNDGAVVYLNGAPVAAYHSPGHEDTATTSVPATAPAFDPLPLVFEINANALAASATPDNNVFTVELYTTADARSTTTFNLRLEGSQEVENLTGWLPVGLVAPETASVDSTANDNPPTSGIESVQGKNRHTIQGTSILTLSDNYFIMRYRAKATDNAAYVAGGGWSKWTEPQLAEGWIKRVLAGINPFQQRVKDLFNHQTNTSVSLVEQAGKRWEGNIALNLDNINDSGLVEIYETVLNRGKDLSITGTPAINYGGANDALLLAAGYLSDLYMILGNEAYADAANSTIAFNTASSANFITQYGDVATALFAFKGQLATVLDEELSLLRGRDDSLLPGSRKTPVYNRLVWNYTRGISSGEAIYALNYNIKDRVWDTSLNPNNPGNLPTDGIISAADAAISYPQGHGDAYGHYLTALTGYYGLLNNPNFSWTPRIEAVLVLGTPVSVDYQDERKFAAAAVAVARTASQTLDLTYRQQYSASETAGWSQLHEEKANPNTGLTRHWGTDDWASRGGQGALFHWVTANSLLPAVDPNPNHSGIQKIDRTTVPELAEIAAQAASIQQTLDNADAHVNPLGLAPGALTFDISPSEVDAGKTHYEQVFARATVALQNAVSAFNNAKGSTQFLRQQEDTLADQRNAILQQERAYANQLIELYGTPYTDDIGPGKTYPQGYEGPDLLHSMYVDVTEDIGGFTNPGGGGGQGPGGQYVLYTTLAPSKLEDIQSVRTGIDGSKLFGDDAGTTPVTGIVPYTFDAISGELRKPTNWNGRRVSPGQMQTAVSDFLLARQNLYKALYDYGRLQTVMGQKIDLFNSAVQAHYDIGAINTVTRATSKGLELYITAAESALEVARAIKAAQVGASFAAQQSLPTVNGLANDVTSTARGILVAQQVAVNAAASASDQVGNKLIIAAKVAKGALEAVGAASIGRVEWTKERQQLVYGLTQDLQAFIDKQGPLDAALRKIDQAQRNLDALQAEGDRIQQARLVFRQHAAAIIQGYRTRDFAFRAFRDEALERYKALFDLSARYTYLAASAYDYETGLLDPNGNASATGFYEKIVQARALGVVSNGVPQFAGASTGDPGLSGVLAEMAGDWSVAKTRLGFNNADNYSTTFSLRGEKFRLLPGTDGDLPWKDKISSYRMGNILEDPDVKRYCMQVADPNGAAVPGIVIPFSSTIATGFNFFGQPLAGGDHTFTPSSFSTKIRSSGMAFAGYVGMDSPTTTSGTLGGIGATSPGTYNSGFSDPNSLSATPYIYLIPAGADSMRSPPLGDTSFIRTWAVQDQAIPLPFNIGNSDYSTQPAWVSAASLSEPAFTLRKHQAFRAVPDGTNFQGGYGFTNARLIGRSAWNSQWKIVIPGNTLLNDPNAGLQTFINTVKDIKLHLETYSYSGN